ERFEALVGRRAARIPLQYLVGSVGFRRLELEVGAGVFVPRPETESVVEIALGLVATVARPRVVDLCTGSGAIALAVAQEHPGAEVLAVEADPCAAEWARGNIDAAGLPVRLLVGDVEDVPAAMNGTVDLVVSNPPYIADGVVLPPEVARHEPVAALYAGADGLDGVRAVERVARRLLRRCGSAVVEHGDDQGQAVLTLFASWHDAVSHQDLAGRDRFVAARRR
ncbi:MAG: peptide chain release factor N(5)-glutamine methyltransferase, partial [Frankiaceae bacterium]